MKKLFVVLILFFVIISDTSYGASKGDFEKNMLMKKYNQYIASLSSTAEETENTENEFDGYVNSVIEYTVDIFHSSFSLYTRKYLLIMLTCMIFSLLISILNSEEMKNIVVISMNLISAVLLFNLFNVVFSEISFTVAKLWEYMDVSMPLFTAYLASAGYNITAKYLQIIFIYSSSIISYITNNYIITALQFVSYVVVANIIIDFSEIKLMIKSSLNLIKNIINIMLILFGATITICGITASTYDNIAFKTARLAISNFVPIVGSCLSESLNSVLYSFGTIKNSTGLIGIIAIIFIALKPIVISIISKVFGVILSFVTAMCGHEKLSENIDMLTSLLSVCGSLILFLSSVFVIVIAIIISFGR